MQKKNVNTLFEKIIFGKFWNSIEVRFPSYYCLAVQREIKVVTANEKEYQDKHSLQYTLNLIIYRELVNWEKKK